MAKDFEHSISIPCVGGLLSAASSDTTFERTLRPLDTGNYDGATYYLEIQAANFDSTSPAQDRVVSLVDSGGTAKATITVPAGTGSTGNYTRLRSSSFTPVSGNEEYRLKLEGTNGAGELEVKSARWWIVQASATKARFEYCLGSWDQASPSNNDTDSLMATQTGNYLPDNSNRHGGFLYGDDLFAGTSVTWEFEVTGWYNEGAGNPAYAGLLDVDDSNNLVASSELEVDGNSTWQVSTVTLTEAQLTDGHLYEWNAKSDGFLKTMRVSGASVFVTVTGLTKMQIQHFLHGGWSGSSNHDSVDHRVLWDADAYSTTSGVKYAQISKYILGSAGNALELNHYGTNDGPGTTGVTQVADQAATSSKTHYEEDVSLTDTYRYGGGGWRTNNGHTIYNQMLLIEIGGTTPLTKSFSDSLAEFSDAVVTGSYPYDRRSFSDTPAIGAFSDTFIHTLAAVLSLTPADTLGALDDAISLQQAAHLNQAVADQLGKITDAYAQDLSVRLSITAADLLGELADDITIESGRWFGSQIVLIVKIWFDSVTEKLSNIHINTPTESYKGRITQFGHLTRSVDIPAGLTRVADGSITVADTDQYFRELFATEIPKGKQIEIRMLPVGGKVATSQRVYLGEIESVDLPEGAVTFHFSDKPLAFLQEDIPPLGTLENFPNLPQKEEVFIPILFGDCHSRLLGDRGAIDCKQIDADGKQWVFSRLDVEEVTTVFRKTPDDEEFSIITSGFSVVKTPMTIEGVDYLICHLEFSTAQEAGTQIRVDVKGYPNAADGTASQNLSVNLKSFLNLIAQQPDSALDLWSFQTLEADFDALGWLCDGAYTQEMDFRSAISQMVGSFNADWFQNKDGKITAAITPVSGAEASFNDTFHLLKETIFHRMPGDAINKIRYNFGITPDGWTEKRVWEDATAQAIVGKVIDRSYSYHFVRDIATAQDVTADIASYLSLQSYWIDFDLTAPRTVDLLELARLVDITHYGGIGVGGYQEEVFKVGEIDFDPNDLRYRVKAIRRIAPPDRQGAQLEDVAWSNHSLAGPYLRGKEFFGVFKDTKAGASQNKRMIIVYSNDYGRNWVRLDEEGFAIMTGVIGSYNSLMGDDDHLHISTQEDTTGRVAYHKFSMASRTWVTVDEEVVSATTTNSDPVHGYGGGGWSPHTTLMITKPSGRPVVVFAADGSAYDPADGTYLFQASTPDDYKFRRMMITHRQEGGGWTTPQRIGADAHNRCCSTSDYGGELVACHNDHVVYFYASLPGYSSASTPDFRAAVYTAGGAVGAQQTYYITSLVYYPAYGGTFGRIGTSLEADGQYRFHVTYKAGYGRAYFSEFLENKLLAGVYDAGTNLLDNQAEWTTYFVGTDGPFDAINESSGATGRTQGQIQILDPSQPAAFPSDNLVFFACYTPKLYHAPLGGYNKTGPSDFLGIQTSQQWAFQSGARTYVCAFFSDFYYDPYFCLWASDQLPLEPGYDLSAFKTEFDLW